MNFTNLFFAGFCRQLDHLHLLVIIYPKGAQHLFNFYYKRGSEGVYSLQLKHNVNQMQNLMF